MTGIDSKPEVPIIVLNYRNVLKVAVPGLGSGRRHSTLNGHSRISEKTELEFINCYFDPIENYISGL